MEKIQLHQSEIYDGALTVTVELMIHAKSPEITDKRRPAMIIFPGGGYGMTSDREAEPIASAYFAAGYNTFTVRYITGEKAKVNNPLYDAAAAIAHVRTNAEKYCIDPDRIAIIGFSAGGHLAGYISTAWHRPDIKEKLGIQFKFHFLRHTYGTLMAEMNTPAHLLCNQMGHGKIQVTQQYYIAVSRSGIDILQQNLDRL